MLRPCEAAAILPEDLHVIGTLPDDDADFALRCGLIKSAVLRVVCSATSRKARIRRRNANIE
jgi:hypothetical protein